MNKEGQSYLLKVFSTILNKMSSAEALDNVCEIILSCLESKRLDLLDRNLVQQISLIISGKIALSRLKGLRFQVQVFRLLDFMVENEMVNEIYRDFISGEISQLRQENGWKRAPKAREEASPSGSSKLDTIREMDETEEQSDSKALGPWPCEAVVERPLNLLETALKKNLFFLLGTNTKAEKYFKNNFGYALLDMRGNFVWADKRTCSTLDLKKPQFSSEDSQLNLFEMMIPPCRNYLRYKFGGHIFQEHDQMGQSRSFSYVIYSRNNMEKCKKFLLSNDKDDPDYPIAKRKDMKRFEIFLKYLKSVSSRATLMLLHHSPRELSSILDSQKCQFEKSSFMFRELMKRKKQSNSRNVNFYIFLESRISETKPEFNYDLLHFDPKIQEFRNEIVKAMEKEKKKKDKQKGGKPKKGKKGRPRAKGKPEVQNQTNGQIKPNLDSSVNFISPIQNGGLFNPGPLPSQGGSEAFYPQPLLRPNGSFLLNKPGFGSGTQMNPFVQQEAQEHSFRRNSGNSMRFPRVPGFSPNGHQLNFESNNLLIKREHSTFDKSQHLKFSNNFKHN